MFDLDKFADGVEAGVRPAVQTGETVVYVTAASLSQHVVNEYHKDAALLVVFDAKGKPVCVFDHFILGSVSEQDQEKSSFLFTFGDAVIFGGMERRTRLYAYSGFLIDSKTDGFCISVWRRLYDKYLRATATADENRYARLYYRDQIRDGYITSCRLSEAADRPQTAVLSFNMFVLDEGVR